MPDTFTPNLHLTLPEIGASRDSWGAKLNDNTTALDQLVSMACPIGKLMDFAGSQAPAGWLIADGRAVSRTTYSDLFAVLAGTWGSGDGTSTFNLPNLNGRASVGPGLVTDQLGYQYSYTLGQMTGLLYNVLGQANLPNYAIGTDAQGNHNHAGYTLAAGAHAHTTDAQGQHNHTAQTTYMSADHTHTGYTDTQGAHQHNAIIPAAGTGAAGGGNTVTSPIFGSAAYLTDTNGWHSHNIQTGGVSANHLHGIYDDGNHAHNVYAVGDHQHQIYYDGNHAHTLYLNGSWAPLEVLNPVAVVTKCVYAGKQAAPAVLLAAEMAPAPSAAADGLTALREEIAELRALLTPRRRVTHAPSRGLH